MSDTQPPIDELETEREGELEIVEQILATHAGRLGALLPILHDVQTALAYIPDVVVPRIAEALNLSRAEVHGVVSFYHSFSTNPLGKHIVEVCRAESCQAMGGERVASAVQNRLGLGWGETDAQAQVTLQEVYCLGNCACSPAMRIGDQIFGRLDAENAIAALESKVLGAQA